MPADVSINGLTAVHQGSNGVSVAFPDVCKTPSPAGPVPIPYPNVAQSSQALGTESTVLNGGQALCHKDSYFLPSSGDEAGAAGGVVSSKIKGKAEFVNFSFNVMIGGKPAVRALDPMLHNDKNTPPFPLVQPPLPGLPPNIAANAECLVCHKPVGGGAAAAGAGASLPGLGGAKAPGSKAAASHGGGPASGAQSATTHSADLVFEYKTDGGLAVGDDDGLELVHPDGKVEPVKVQAGRFKKSGAKPGVYELRAKALQAARWGTSDAHPFVSVPLAVTGKNIADGTAITVEIRRAWEPGKAAPFATVQLTFKDGSARGVWAYEQPVGQPAVETFWFEAQLGKKRARSGTLRVVPHDAKENLGVQERLRSLGYDPGPPSDELNKGTRDAVESFQKDHPPLLVDGIAGPLTRRELARLEA